MTKDGVSHNLSYLTKDKLKEIDINNLKFFYINEANFHEIYQEIFVEQVYDVHFKKDDHYIIDCGSNIGMSIVYLKMIYPRAKIICFEPDPNAFMALTQNIKENQLSDIRLVHAALSDQVGEVNFYGEFYGDEPNSLGNSINRFWGDRGYTDVIKVQARELSHYIDRPVDFLKLDVEGAELRVIQDLDKNNKLKYVKKIALEIHQVENNGELDKLENIKSLLKANGFKLNVTEKDIRMLLPDIQKPWIEKSNPQLYIVDAENSVL